jgi:FkbH-like protein
MLEHIKLVIWDLDGTIWDGTLSEEGYVSPRPEFVNLVKSLARKGVLNSVCSKGSLTVAREWLKEIRLWELFTFPSIEPSPKGQRVAQIVASHCFLPESCLLVDDELANLEEARFVSPTLNTLPASDINDLVDYCWRLSTVDEDYAVLKRYREIERREGIRTASSLSNLDFLRQSDIQVRIGRDCVDHVGRIHDIVLKTNQLNYTQLRPSLDELTALLNDPTVDAGYVEVRDKYLDYGLCGFYAMREGKLLHFLFSCRLFGSGVDSYVYQLLGKPVIVSGKEVPPCEDESIYSVVRSDEPITLKLEEG